MTMCFVLAALSVVSTIAAVALSAAGVLPVTGAVAYAAVVIVVQVALDVTRTRARVRDRSRRHAA